MILYESHRRSPQTLSVDKTGFQLYSSGFNPTLGSCCCGGAERGGRDICISIKFHFINKFAICKCLCSGQARSWCSKLQSETLQIWKFIDLQWPVMLSVRCWAAAPQGETTAKQVRHTVDCGRCRRQQWSRSTGRTIPEVIHAGKINICVRIRDSAIRYGWGQVTPRVKRRWWISGSGGGHYLLIRILSSLKLTFEGSFFGQLVRKFCKTLCKKCHHSGMCVCVIEGLTSKSSTPRQTVLAKLKQTTATR